jgi:hypothetical protein
MQVRGLAALNAGLAPTRERASYNRQVTCGTVILGHARGVTRYWQLPLPKLTGFGCCS